MMDSMDGLVDYLQVVYIPDPSRVTVLVKLDAQPDDYAIRISSTSEMQNLHGYAILRYRVCFLCKHFTNWSDMVVVNTSASIR